MQKVRRFLNVHCTMLKKPLNITSYIQRPIDNNKEPTRIPITEWEYDEIHAGERPRTGNTSSSYYSEPDMFSVGSPGSHPNTSDSDDELNQLYIPNALGDKDLMNIDPNTAGKALQGELKFIANSHFETEERIKKQKEATKATLSTFKYNYFYDIPDEDEQSNLPRLGKKSKSKKINKSTRSLHPQMSRTSTRKSPNTSPQSSRNSSPENRTNTLTIEGRSSTNLLKSITNSPKNSEIKKRTSALREQKSPKYTTTSEFSISDDDLDLLKSESATIKNLKSPVKEKTKQGTAEMREERKPKIVEKSSDDNFELTFDDVQGSGIHPYEDTLQRTEFQISDDSELERTLENPDKPSVELYATGTKGMDCLDTSELLKTVKSFNSSQITQEQYDYLNRPKNKMSSKNSSPEHKSPKNTLKKTVKYAERKKSPDSPPKQNKSSPPVFSRYLKENSPKPKLKDDTPTRFKYDVKPLKNDPPSMYKNHPPKPPKKVELEQPTRIKYNPNEIPDNPPTFLTDKNRNKMTKKKIVFEENPLKEFESEDEEQVINEHKRKKMIEERVNKIHGNNSPNAKSVRGKNSNKQQKQLSPEQKDAIRKKNEKERRMFYDPAETQASKLRNQRIRQKLALKHEQERLLEEAEVERLQRQHDVYLQLEPELRRLAQISKERQGKAKKFVGRANHPKSVESIQNALKKVDETEVLLRRNDRSLILKDVMNKRTKERREKQKSDELHSLEKRKNANEKLRKMWS